MFFNITQTVGYDYNPNEIVDATIVSKTECSATLKATISKENCQCDYTVHAVSDIPNRWERYITMKITPSNGLFEIFRGDVFALNSEISRKFQLCTGDSIKGELHIIPASGSCDPARPDAVNPQRESYTVWVTNPNGTEVFRRTFGPGTATQSHDYLMFNIPVDCPYSTPFTYTYSWNPSGKTTPTITEGGSGNVLYTVTATNVQHPQCKFKDSILVPFTCAALPIQFISVSSIKTDFGAIVKWQTIEDDDRSPYIVERSSNPLTGFTPIGTIPVYAGSYSFNDYNVPDGEIVYYRIVKKNSEGQIIYSKIVSINSSNTSFSLYPNPFNNSAFLQSNSFDKKYSVELLDLLGQIVEVHNLENHEPVEIGTNLSSGVYVVKIYDYAGTTETIKLVKSK